MGLSTPGLPPPNKQPQQNLAEAVRLPSLLCPHFRKLETFADWLKGKHVQILDANSLLFNTNGKP